MNADNYFNNLHFTKENIEKLDALIELIEFDAINTLSSKKEKLVFIKRIIEKINQLDSKMYSFNRIEIMKRVSAALKKNEDE